MQYFRIHCIVDPRDVLTVKVGKKTNIVSELIDVLKRELHYSSVIVEESTYSTASLVFAADELPGDTLIERLSDDVCNRFDIKKVNLEVSSIDISSWQTITASKKGLNNGSAPGVHENGESDDEGSDESQSTAFDAASISDDNDDKDDETDTVNDAYSEIQSLVGMDAFKKWADDVKGVYERYKDDPNMLSVLGRVTYTVSINPGNGLSRLAELMGRMLAKCMNCTDVTVKEEWLSIEKNGINPIDSGFSFSRYSDSLQVYVLHLDKIQSQLHSLTWRDFLKDCWDKKCKAVYIFAVPYLEDVLIADIHNSINDLFFNQVIKIQPFSNNDYLCFFEKYLAGYGISISNDAHDLLIKKIAQEKSDGGFYGINTIYKICDEIMYIKMLDSKNSNTVTPEDVSLLLTNYDSTPNGLTGLQQLDRLIALNNVKARVREILALIKLNRRSNKESTQSMHMIFSGCPGTGKTAVARIIGRIFKEEGILFKGDFYEVTRKDLVGEFIGHTAPKTADVCRSAYGSVLFIDEAYMLDGGGEKDFGKEAIGTLISEMENNRDKLIVIFAGYAKDLEKLFSLNPGLRDRIPYHVEFPNYSREELGQIFFVQLGDKYGYDEDFKARVTEYFNGLSDEVINGATFSNGRFVRNVLERTISKAALRVQMEETYPETVSLTVSDFNLAVGDVEFRDLNTKSKPKRIGF